MSGGDSPIIKTATNEYVLLANRVFVSGCAAIIVWFATGIRQDTTELKREFATYQLVNEARISKVEGQMSVIDSAIRMQTKNIETHEITIQSLWSRIYDLASGRQTVPGRQQP